MTFEMKALASRTCVSSTLLATALAPIIRLIITFGKDVQKPVVVGLITVLQRIDEDETPAGLQKRHGGLARTARGREDPSHGQGHWRAGLQGLSDRSTLLWAKTGHSRMKKPPKSSFPMAVEGMADLAHEFSDFGYQETDDPDEADRRRYYKVEKWDAAEQHVEAFLCASNDL
jgi:hypothetical protein